MNLGKRGLNLCNLGQRGAHLTFGACSHRLALRSRPSARASSQNRHRGVETRGVRTAADFARSPLARLWAIGVGAFLLAAAGIAPAQTGGRVLTTSDVVTIRVLSQPDLDTTTRVEPDGTIQFPYVGRMKAAGLSEGQLERAIERRLVELKILVDK